MHVSDLYHTKPTLLLKPLTSIKTLFCRDGVEYPLRARNKVCNHCKLLSMHVQSDAI